MQFAEFSSDDDDDEPKVPKKKMKFANWEEEYYHKEFSKKFSKSLREQLGVDFNTLRFYEVIFENLKKMINVEFTSTEDKKVLYTLTKVTSTWTKTDDYFPRYVPHPDPRLSEKVLVSAELKSVSTLDTTYFKDVNGKWLKNGGYTEQSENPISVDEFIEKKCTVLPDGRIIYHSW